MTQVFRDMVGARVDLLLIADYLEERIQTDRQWIREIRANPRWDQWAYLLVYWAEYYDPKLGCCGIIRFPEV